jgi:hypothetical protein
MPDLNAVMKAYPSIYDVLSFGDSIVIVFHDNNPDSEKVLHEIKSFLKISSTITLSRLFSKAGLFLDYHSEKHGKILYSLFGLEKQLLMTYSLESLSHSQKTMFGYALKGRGSENGILGELNGEIVGRNSLSLPLKGAESLKSFMAYWKVEFSMRTIYVDIQQKRSKK